MPAAVSIVTITNNSSDSLNVSWRAAEGDVDSYMVMLKDLEKIVHTLAVSKATTDCAFSSLVSGRLYTIVITTHSGSYRNQTLLQARTSMKYAWNFPFPLFWILNVMAALLMLYDFFIKNHPKCRTPRPSTRREMTFWRFTGIKHRGIMTIMKWWSNITAHIFIARTSVGLRASVCSVIWFQDDSIHWLLPPGVDHITLLFLYTAEHVSDCV